MIFKNENKWKNEWAWRTMNEKRFIVFLYRIRRSRGSAICIYPPIWLWGECRRRWLANRLKNPKGNWQCTCNVIKHLLWLTSNFGRTLFCKVYLNGSISIGGSFNFCWFPFIFWIKLNSISTIKLNILFLRFTCCLFFKIFSFKSHFKSHCTYQVQGSPWNRTAR